MKDVAQVRLIAPDAGLRQTLEGHLAASGFEVRAFATPAEALDAGTGADCAVIDEAGAADADYRLLAERLACPLILLSTRADQACPPAGVLGVVAKPLRLAVLVSRLRAILAGRGEAPSRIGPWAFDCRARTLDDGAGRRVRLTDKEAAILAFLCRQPGPVARERLLAEIWGYSAGIDTHTLETHVYRLRRKIEPHPGHAALLLTEEGGYRLAASFHPGVGGGE